MNSESNKTNPSILNLEPANIHFPMFAEWLYKAGQLMTRERAALSASVLMFIGREVLLVAGSIVLSVSVLMFIG